METTDQRSFIKVWQAADLAQLELHRGFSVARPVARHWHDEYQLCLIESGSGFLTYPGANFPTPPASLFIVHPGEVHSNRAFDNLGCSYRTMFLHPDLVQNTATDVKGKSSELPFFPGTVIVDADLIEDFVALHIALEKPSSGLETQVLMQAFVVKLLDRFAEDRISANLFPRESRAVDRAYDFLTANFAKNISLEELAAVANLSQFHFSRVFSEQFGMPPHAFQTQVRVSEAKRLLRQGAPTK